MLSYRAVLGWMSGEVINYGGSTAKELQLQEGTTQSLHYGVIKPAGFSGYTPFRRLNIEKLTAGMIYLCVVTHCTKRVIVLIV